MAAGRSWAEGAPNGKAEFLASSFEHLDRSVWIGRLRSEVVDCELCRLTGRHLYVQIVIVLFGRFAFPIEVFRVIRRKALDHCSTGQNRILLCASAAQNEILHAIHLKSLGGVHMAVEYYDVQILGIGRNRFVWILC